MSHLGIHSGMYTDLECLGSWNKLTQLSMGVHVAMESAHWFGIWATTSMMSSWGNTYSCIFIDRRSWTLNLDHRVNLIWRTWIINEVMTRGGILKIMCIMKTADTSHPLRWKCSHLVFTRPNWDSFYTVWKLLSDSERVDYVPIYFLAHFMAILNL